MVPFLVRSSVFSLLWDQQESVVVLGTGLRVLVVHYLVIAAGSWFFVVSGTTWDLGVDIPLAGVVVISIVPRPSTFRDS